MKISKDQLIEIRCLKEQSAPTRRACVPALEEILYEPLAVLTDGFVRVIDYMGDDRAVVQAARVSYGSGTKKNSDDKGLIRYLMRHRHTTPFEMCEIKLHVKLPIFVARQWIRHRTANVNEYSARYSILDKEFYVPDQAFLSELKSHEKHESHGQQSMLARSLFANEIAPQSTENKQGRSGSVADEYAKKVAQTIQSESARAHTIYSKLLNEGNIENYDQPERGLARELARIVLPVNYFTQWYWKIDLHNLLHFLQLRMDQHAQYEIRQYAERIADIVRKWTPFTWEAFEEYRLGAVTLSATALAVVRRLLAGEDVTQADSGLSPREWRELMAALGRNG